MAYTLCTSERDLATALQTLSQSQHLVLDCEGRELGMQGGALSLISIGTAEGDSVFLIDTISIPRGTPATCDLVALLGRADVHKLMWDGRQDGIALREAYGVVLKGVVDMQLAEVVSRGAARGEDDEARLKRLIHLIGGKVLHTPNSYLEVHCLAGLDSSLKQFNVGLEHTKSDAMKTLHRNHGSSLWMERPLSSELLSYAANDIRGIAALHKFFDQAGWLSSATMRDILSQSARYLAIHDTRGPVDPTDIFRKGPFLPLDILSSPKGATQICEACLRRISSRHFDTVGKKGKRKSSCRVCEAMKLKIKFDKKKAEAKEKKVAEREAKAASQQPAVIEVTSGSGSSVPAPPAARSRRARTNRR